MGDQIGRKRMEELVAHPGLWKTWSNVIPGM